MHKIKAGFTLVEMLIVIAIIAVLIAILVPAVSTAERKAEAAADAANLRSVLGQLNTELLDDASLEDLTSQMFAPESQSFPGAEIQILYSDPGFIEVYYVKGHNYYGLSYLSEIAERAVSSVPVTKPQTVGNWYHVGNSAVH